MKKLLFVTIIFILFFTRVINAQDSNIKINYRIDRSAGMDIGLSYVYFFTDDEISKVWGFLKTAKEEVRYDLWDSKYIEKKLSCNNITFTYSEEWKPDWNKEKRTGVKSYKYFANDYAISVSYNSEEYFIRFYDDKSLVFLFRQQKNGGYSYHHTTGVEVHNSKISNANIDELRKMIPLDVLEKLKDTILKSIIKK